MTHLRLFCADRYLVPQPVALGHERLGRVGVGLGIVNFDVVGQSPLLWGEARRTSHGPWHGSAGRCPPAKDSRSASIGLFVTIRYLHGQESRDAGNGGGGSGGNLPPQL